MFKKFRSYLLLAIMNRDSHMDSCVNQEILISSIKLIAILINPTWVLNQKLA